MPPPVKVLLRTSIHVCAVANYLICIVGQLSSAPMPKDVIDQYPQMGFDKFGGSWKYLTFWNLWFQLVYFIICLANDFRGRSKGKSKT